MGMVLLEYDPVKVCWEYTDNPEDVEWMRRELFDSKEWSLLDEGTLTDAQALERVQKSGISAAKFQVHLEEHRNACQMNICAGWRRKVWNTGMSTTSGQSRGWESW